MELRHLRYFVAVAEEENVTRAASRLHVSQPALSRQIRDLEEEIGFLLLERSAKSVRLTEAGRTFLDEARKVLQAADNAVKTARAKAAGAQGEVHVGYAPSLTIQILPRALRRFQAQFPRVRVRLHDLSTEEIVKQLHTGKLQLALTVQPSRKMLRGLRFREIDAYPMRMAIPPGHRLFRARAVKVSELAREPLIAYTRADYPEYHDTLNTLFKLGKTKPVIAEEHDSVTSLIAAVEAGRGIALLPSCVACMVGPRMKLIPLNPPAAPIVVGAVVREGNVSEFVEKLIEAAATKETEI